MALLPENLSDYSLSGLFAMADLTTEIEARAANYVLPNSFLESLDELRGDIDQEIKTVMADMEEKDLYWLPQPVAELEPCPLPR
jgi:hypothetical protein